MSSLAKQILFCPRLGQRQQVQSSFWRAQLLSVLDVHQPVTQNPSYHRHTKSIAKERPALIQHSACDFLEPSEGVIRIKPHQNVTLSHIRESAIPSEGIEQHDLVFIIVNQPGKIIKFPALNGNELCLCKASWVFQRALSTHNSGQCWQ